ncbi:MAG: DUF6884 domain-containing protein [Candidatus Heimdallarchaeaceae archaeon]
MNIIYVTYCSGKKYDIKYGKPKELYNSRRIQTFIKVCELMKQRYGILSGKYGLVFDNEIIKNYDVYIGDLNNEKLLELANITEKKLKEKKIGKVIFYEPNPQRSKKYRKILEYGNITFETIKKVKEIKPKINLLSR